MPLITALSATPVRRAGSPSQQLAPVWKAFGIQPQTKALEHSAHVVLVDAHGVQRIGFPFEHLTPEGLAHDLTRLAGT